MPAGKKKFIWISVFLLLFGAGIAGGYLFFSKRHAVPPPEQAAPQTEARANDSAFVRIYYPSEGRLIMEERRVRRAPEASMADETVEEFLKGPSQAAGTAKSVVPVGTKLLGLYRGSDSILYIDLSQEFRRNFQGDAAAEFLLLKGLYESVISNVSGVDDIKLTIEGKEIESIGGHLFALYPLKNTVAEGK